MTSTVSRLVPRHKGSPAVRTADRIRADIEASEREGADAIAEGQRLTSQTRAVLLSGDDAAHERHEAEIARMRRIHARTEARQEELRSELADAEAREVETAQDNRRSEAEAAVAAVVAKVPKHYTEPAEQIAAFLAEWTEATRLAREAGVPGPDAAQRRPWASRMPDREVVTEAYVDDQGNATQNPHPYKPDGSVDRTRMRARRTFTRIEPGGLAPPRHLPPLAELVNLPLYGEVGEHHQGTRVRSNRWG